MENINDPNILLSMVNMKLRDRYSSLDSLCEDLDLNKDYLVEKLRSIGYEYSEEENAFR